MKNYDSKNGINHKCPCCNYEVEWDWKEDDFIKGDASFIQIHSPHEYMTCFETDKPYYTSHGSQASEKVILLGCPKCKTISFKFQ